MLTYININEYGDSEFHDGFSCGGFVGIIKPKDILDHINNGWYDEREVWIGDENDPKAKYVREQWMKILKEIESGGLKHGMRFGWFSESEGKVVDEIEKFRAALCNIGYDVKDSLVDKIFKVEETK